MVTKSAKPWALATLGVVITTGVAIAQPGKTDRSVASFEPEAPTVSDAEALRLEYSAPANCPNAAQFLDRVTARSKRFRTAKPNELARVLHIDIVSVGADMAGEARMLQAGSATPLNFVTVGGCSVVVDRLVQFALGQTSTGSQLAAAVPRDGALPGNPYLDWQGPIAESLPQNPYPRQLNDIGRAIAVAKAQETSDPLAVAARNPYRW